MSRVDARCSLVVKVCQLVALFRSQEPEIQERARKDRVYFSGGKTDERCKRESHLPYFGVESWIVLACGLHRAAGVRKCKDKSECFRDIRYVLQVCEL